MKTASEIYTGKELATTRKPRELFHLWSEYRTWPWDWKTTEPKPAPTLRTDYYYTSANEDIVYDGNTYTPAPIARTAVQTQTQFEASTVKINTVLMDPVVEFIASNPTDIVNIKILRLFSDQAPYEAGVIFIGQIKHVSFQGIAAQVECQGFENAIRRPIPKFRYQPTCNWSLYDMHCKVSSAYPNNWGDAITAMSENGLYLTMGRSWATDFFTRGFVIFNNSHRRMIVDSGPGSTGHDIMYLRYPIPGLKVGDIVQLYAGCDGTMETCLNKFNNINNFMGFPYIPYDNPATWSGR